MPLQLLDLPMELLMGLPPYLHNIEDFMNAASSCRTLRTAFDSAHPKSILGLAARSAPVFFGPHPWFLVLGTARQVGEWAIGNDNRTEELCKAFQGGIGGLYDLCLRVGGLKMEDIRRLHLARFSTINPLVKKLDQMAGREWYALDVDDFWNGGVSEANTVCCEEQSGYQIMIYWELFGGTLRSFFQPELKLPRFGLQTRLDYIKYCIPDWMCEGGYPGLEVLPVGPYSPEAMAANHNYAGTDQIALNHILSCGRWQRLWRLPRWEAGDDFSTIQDTDYDKAWRQDLWQNALMSFGLESMEIIKDVKITSDVDWRFPAHGTTQPCPVLTPEWKERLSVIREQIERLDASTDQPQVEEIGERLPYKLSQAPKLSDEVFVCMRALWPGVRPNGLGSGGGGGEGDDSSSEDDEEHSNQGEPEI